MSSLCEESIEKESLSSLYLSLLLPGSGEVGGHGEHLPGEQPHLAVGGVRPGARQLRRKGDPEQEGEEGVAADVGRFLHLKTIPWKSMQLVTVPTVDRVLFWLRSVRPSVGLPASLGEPTDRHLADAQPTDGQAPILRQSPSEPSPGFHFCSDRAGGHDAAILRSASHDRLRFLKILCTEQGTI